MKTLIQLVPVIVVVVCGMAAAQSLPAAAFTVADSAIVTFYVPDSGRANGWGFGQRQPWYMANLYDNDQRLTGNKAFNRNRFLTFKLPAGVHKFSGTTNFSHKPSKEKSEMAFEAGNHYFVRLSLTSKGLGLLGSTHYVAEMVGCQQAFTEAGKSHPVSPRNIDQVAIRWVIP